MNDAEFAIAWSVLLKLETEAEDAAEFYDAVEKMLGPEGLIRGLALCTAVMREHLREHAARLGCDCGSDEWLRREQLDNARRP